MTFCVKLINTRFTFRALILGSQIVEGVLLIIMSAWHQFWIAIFLWAAINALVVLINLNITSLEQRIVPNALLGRIASVEMVLSWCFMPLGMLAGGAAITATNHIDWVFSICGIALLSIPLPFFFTNFGRLTPPQKDTAEETEVSYNDPVVELSD
ncbi:hypothetical protein KDAU_64450 [Dictyobacter aurantiacus]|uniref:Major facilitator superfamily (MFS) profile domain-containing protein n=2 Tax=Dictyobacter aurantiacus TaxID=1936993 RepID=A0A401ZQT2_9CHLR|nr:hypothetical protein KDAU_64450 [Dictyobacter aurantiacus]